MNRHVPRLFVVLFPALLLAPGLLLAQAGTVYVPLIYNQPPAPTSQPTSPAPAPDPTEAPTPTRDPARCDPSYPTVCIPPPPPDLNCDDIPYRNFPVLQPDPHRFDTDKDGIGCEE